MEKDKLKPEVRHDEDAANRRLFVLQIVQPGLAGLMDGSVSTLAPVFAAAFATHGGWDAFRVGLAASSALAFSMGFAAALSDDGSPTGRGHPWARGSVCGLMTALGGVGHTLPFLVPDFRLAMTAAVVVVAVELANISWIQHKYMDSPSFFGRGAGWVGWAACVWGWSFDWELVAGGLMSWVGWFVHFHVTIES